MEEKKQNPGDKLRAIRRNIDDEKKASPRPQQVKEEPAIVSNDFLKPQKIPQNSKLPIQRDLEEEKSSLIDNAPINAPLPEEEKKAEPVYIAPRPQVMDQLMGGNEDDQPEIIVEQKIVKIEGYKGNLAGLSYVPQTYVQQFFGLKNLDIANLQEPDKKQRDRADFFVCPICANVVLNPVECGGCQSVFCNDCIVPWKEKNDSCPKKCKGNNAVEWREVHRLVKQDLQNLEFKCENQGCDKVLAYQAAMDHKDKCELVMQPCTQGCGLGLLGKDMEFHIQNQCSETSRICEDCEEKIYTNRVQEKQHDCKQTLKENLKKAREEIAMLKAQLASQSVPTAARIPQARRINNEQIYDNDDDVYANISHSAQVLQQVTQLVEQRLGRDQIDEDGTLLCNQGHPMMLMHGNPAGYGGPASCDLCRQDDLGEHENFYHCVRCQYDVCQACAAILR